MRRRSPVTLGLLYPTRRMLPPRAKSFIDLAADELRRSFERPSSLSLKAPGRRAGRRTTV